MYKREGLTLEEFKNRYQKAPVKAFENTVSENVHVSVCIHTYQHIKYIEECLDGILNQKTSFAFEILLGEDESTDGTREKCMQYAKDHPDRIRLFLHDRKNNIKIGGMVSGRFNFLYNILNARGKYIAFCEGDDFWTDQYKLQKQVDFLEQNREFMLVFGNAEIQDLTEGYHRKGLYLDLNEDNCIESERVVNLGMPTLTMLFRNELVLPKWYVNVVSGDDFIVLLLSKQGKLYYQNEVFGVHRKHNTGFSRVADRLSWNVNTAKYLKMFVKEALPDQKSSIELAIARSYIYAYFTSIVDMGGLGQIGLLSKIIFNRGTFRRSSLGLIRMLFIDVCLRGKKDNLDRF